MGITEIDGSEFSDSDYGITDSLTSPDSVMLYIIVLLAIAGAGLFFLQNDNVTYIRTGVAAAGILCLALHVFFSLSLIAEEFGASIGDLGELGLEVGWEIGLWLTLLAFIVAIVMQFVPLPDGEPASED